MVLTSSEVLNALILWLDCLRIKINIFRGDISDVSAVTARLVTNTLTMKHQRFFCSRTIGYVTPETVYFYYRIKYFLDQSIQKYKKNYLIFKSAAL